MRLKNNLRLLAIIILIIAVFVVVPAQDMRNMPGMKMGNSKSNKKKNTTKKKPPAKRHNMGNMARMNMPGMKMSSTHRSSKRRPTTERSSTTTAKKPAMKSMPGMNMPGMNMPKAQASPTTKAQGQMQSMPGMQMPTASPSPSSSPQQMNMPGMQMPSASPQASPQQKMQMNMPMPNASPSPGAMQNMPGMNMPNASPSPGAMENMKGMENMPGMNTDMGPLGVMSGDDMGVRVGASETNVMFIGQMGSGTSWQPISTPVNMMDRAKGDWLFMLHYNAVVGVNSQGGPRGATKFESANWFMPMAFHKLGKGTVELRGMISFEPFTFAHGGSPLLFQTGETFNGQPLVDRQHPHDFWMELSTTYTVPVSERMNWFFYFGYPGEPALGPPAFMHRTSASENPSATLSHHLQDSTHISFGVFTTGFSYRWFKLEGSIFNGREPDENRYNFEAHPWNSHSVRLSFAPNKNWSAQVSYGFLRHPEALEPGDVRRTTASISYNRPFNRGNWATSFIWGRNHLNSFDKVGNLNGYTGESTVNFLDKNYLYTRLELVDKDDLLRPAERAQLGITEEHPSFRIGAYTFGGVRDVWTTDKFLLGIGSDVTFYSKPSVLDQFYGNHPVSWRLFVRIRPAKMKMGSTVPGMHGNMNQPQTKP
jgi:hypothetical protein